MAFGRSYSMLLLQLHSPYAASATPLAPTTPATLCQMDEAIRTYPGILMYNATQLQDSDQMH
jgi:hypothetical protein